MSVSASYPLPASPSYPWALVPSSLARLACHCFVASISLTMVNWSDPAEVARDGGRSAETLRLASPHSCAAAVFEKLLIVFLGVTIWEIFVTGDFEWSLITGKRRFKWPLVRM